VMCCVVSLCCSRYSDDALSVCCFRFGPTRIS
jgi:hypothetical protein